MKLKGKKEDINKQKDEKLSIQNLENKVSNMVKKINMKLRFGVKKKWKSWR